MQRREICREGRLKRGRDMQRRGREG
jgi:hypothetical protein